MLENNTDKITLQMGVFAETLVVKSLATYYQILKRVLEQSLDVEIEQIGSPKEDFLNWNMSKGSLPNNFDIIIYPMPLQLMGERIQNNVSGFVANNVASLVMFTAPPKIILIETEDIFKMKINVLLLLLLCIHIIALISSTRFYKKHKSRKRMMYLSIVKYLENVWSSIVLFFFEPNRRSPQDGASRFSLGAWMIAVAFITIQVTSSMKSEFAFISHDEINTLDDLTHHPQVQPKVLKHCPDDRLINILAERSNGFRYLHDKINSVERTSEMIDFLDDAFYKSFQNSEMFILSKNLLEHAVGLAFEDSVLNEVAGILFISAPISELYLSFPLSERIAQNEMYYFKVKRLFTRTFETQCLYHVVLKNKYILNILKWKQPNREEAVLKFSEIRRIYEGFICGLFFCFLIVVAEIIIKCLFPTAMRKKNVNRNQWTYS